ncbi:MAG: DNA repair protein RadA [Sphingomonadales bacterium]
MAKPANSFICQSCGAAYRKWVGRCEACDGWNTVVEEAPLGSAPRGLGAAKGRVFEFQKLSGEITAPPRLMTGIEELDRVCGGGLVPGSAVLIGGDPGIGKSTILLQAFAGLARQGARAVFISGEEAVAQIRMRAERLGLADADIALASETGLRDILTTIGSDTPPQALVIDSIQTMYIDTVDSAPGTVAQVRACSQELIRFAKRRGIALFLVGHVTKDGQIAGPRVVEHMVDTVLYFEGERGHQFRILRAVKNRFGGTDEIGVFEMTDGGLAEVANPSELFLNSRRTDVSGSVVFAGVEGTRPVLVELQALVSASPLATPRRAVVGWDSGRLAMVLAVLDTRFGARLSGNDIYLNVAGGLRILEPAADLAVAAALLSVASGTPAPEQSIFFGEIGLSGEVRPVTHAEARLREAAKLGFTRVYAPSPLKAKRHGMTYVQIDNLGALMEVFDADPASHGG